MDYISGGERVGREMRYVAETTEGERIGDWTPSPTAMRTTRFHKHSGIPAFDLTKILYMPFSLFVSSNQVFQEKTFRPARTC